MWFRCGLGLRRGRLSRPCLVVTRFTHVISLSRFLALSLFGPLPPLSVPKALETRQKKKKKDSSIDRDRRSGPGGGEGRYTRGLWKPSEVVGRPTKRGPLPRRLRLTHHTATLEGNLGLLGGALVTSRSDGGPVTTKQIHIRYAAQGDARHPVSVYRRHTGVARFEPTRHTPRHHHSLLCISAHNALNSRVCLL